MGDVEMHGEGAARLLDAAHLSRHAGGDAALAREVLALFQGQLMELLDGWRAGDAATRRLMLHRLKGAAGAVGALPLADRIAALESGPQTAAALEDLERLARATLAAARRTA